MGLNNNMTKKIKWRLAERPTPSEISLLVEKELLTKDEAREILFSQEDEVETDKKALESEIKFLRELAQRLSNKNRSTIIETVREVQVPWRRYPWFQQYDFYCTAGTSGNLALYSNSATTAGSSYTVSNQAQNFSDIKTF